MGIILDREEHGYVVRKDSEILSRLVGSTFDYALKKAQEKAKAIREKLFVTQAAISDWYVGVPFEGKPVIFYDTNQIFAATHPDKFRYLEGPFMDSEEAAKACLKLTGELGEIQP
jgi:hypothetical protein